MAPQLTTANGVLRWTGWGRGTQLDKHVAVIPEGREGHSAADVPGEEKAGSALAAMVRPLVAGQVSPWD